MTNTKLNIFGSGSLLLAFSFLLSIDANAQNCAIPPTCESLGYNKTADSCKGIPSLVCPFDKNKFYCGACDAVFTQCYGRQKLNINICKCEDYCPEGNIYKDDLLAVEDMVNRCIDMSGNMNTRAGARPGFPGCMMCKTCPADYEAVSTCPGQVTYTGKFCTIGDEQFMPKGYCVDDSQGTCVEKECKLNEYFDNGMQCACVAACDAGTVHQSHTFI